jgi:hypothetical protein
MPALSPTMTEGNIASWKVKEGDSFSAGDVLLVIETDKASMDVEAQDDGIVAKIFQGDGAKGIKIGTRIGVIAEPGDDLSSLEIPAEQSASAPEPKKEAAKPEPAKQESQVQKPQESSQSGAAAKPSAKPQKQTYPLLPSVETLMHQNGLDHSAIDQMTPSGPGGRLLKGDVLAYLGTVPASYPSELADGIKKLTHLDLSNIKIAAPAAPPKKAAEAPAAPAPPPAPKDVQVALPISMVAAIEVQKRIQSTLGVFLPLSTFIARAADVANDDLPRSKIAEPTADELFNEVLGLNNVRSVYGVRGNFMPQITALPHTALATRPRVAPKAPEIDIVDFLSGNKIQGPKRAIASPLPGPASTTNIFSVSVQEGDEQRAKVFLERIKTVLEDEPGRLVL